MSQILIVDQRTGVYYNVDSSGHKLVDANDEVTGMNDCTVFMERMMAGHIDLPLHHQAVQLDLTDNGWVVSRVIQYVGSSITLKSIEFKFPGLDPIEPGDMYALAVYDYEAMSFMWVDNPIGESWSTTDASKASCVALGSTGSKILKLAKEELIKELPLHVSVIEAVLL